MSAVGIGEDLGKKGINRLVGDTVTQSVNSQIQDKIEPRLAAIESRVASIEARLDVADRIAKLEADVAALKTATRS